MIVIVGSYHRRRRHYDDDDDDNDDNGRGGKIQNQYAAAGLFIYFLAGIYFAIALFLSN